MKTEKNEHRIGLPVQSQLKAGWWCTGKQADKCKEENKARYSAIDHTIDHNNPYLLKASEEEYRKCMNTC